MNNARPSRAGAVAFLPAEKQKDANVLCGFWTLKGNKTLYKCSCQCILAVVVLIMVSFNFCMAVA